MARIPGSSMHLGAKEPSGFVVGDDERLSEELAVIQGNVFNGEAVDGVFRGQPGGLSLLAVTNQRLMMVDGHVFDDHCAVLSLPLRSVSGVGFLAGPDESLMTTATVGILIQGRKHVLVCR